MYAVSERILRKKINERNRGANRLGIVFWQEESIGKERILKISDSRYHRYISFVNNTNSHLPFVKC